MRTVRSAALLVAVLALGIPASADLDLGVPMGTPLDWEQELHQPIPTGIQGDKAPKAGRRGRRRPEMKDGKQGTVIQGPKVKPPAMGFTSVNLYNFLRVKTHDIMTHFQVQIPQRNGKPVGVPAEPPTFKTGSASKDAKKIKGAGKFEPGITSNYAPKIPGELAWIGIANCLRTILHPELISNPEVIGYLVEIGDPSLVGANSVESAIRDRLKGLIKDVPGDMPIPPSVGNPIDNMIAKVAALELVGGYPHALDPTYAWRTLMLGDEAYPAIKKCVASPHEFLSANALVVFSNFTSPEVTKELETIAKSGKEPTKIARAIAGLSRRKDPASIPTLSSLAKSGEDWVQAMAIYALGHVGTKDKKVAGELVSIARGAGVDKLWSVLPALARVSDNSPQTVKALEDIYRSTWNAAKGIPHPVPPGPTPTDFRAPQPEPAGYKKRIVADLAQIAAAACGSVTARQELLAKLSGGGLKAFTEGSQLLLAEMLGSMGPAGVEAAKKLCTNSEVVLAMAAMKGLSHSKPPDTKWVKEFVMGGGNPLVVAAGLTVLYKHTVGDILDACHHVLKGGIGGAEGAYLVGMAVQMLNHRKDLQGEEIINIIQQAKGGNWSARRNATDEYDITKARIDVSPPLLEIAVLASPGSGDPAIIPVLLEILKSNAAAPHAAIALGGAPLEGENLKAVVQTLIDALADPKNGWLRFCAYRSLKNITKEDYWVDYVFGSSSSIIGAQLRYQKWLDSKLGGGK